MKTTLHLVRPGADPDLPLADRDLVVYIENQQPDRFRTADGRSLTADELLDAIFEHDRVVTW